MSAATLPPWLAPWSGVVYGQRTPERYRPRPRLTIYTLGHGNNAPILSWAEEGSGAGLRGAEGSAAPAVRWERVPLDREPWHVDVPVPVQPRLRDRPPPFDNDVEFGGGSAAALAAWGGVLRGWAAGATLLALLVVLVRVGERLLDWKILLRRRRLHREWQRANVRATARLDGPPPLTAELGSECTVEMPPPYSACGPAGSAGAAGAAGAAGGVVCVPKEEHEEPPPPYSDVVTQFFDKNGLPVLLYSRDPPRPAPVDETDESQRAFNRILRAYGADCPIGTILAELPPPDDPDTRLFRHVYRAFTGRDEIDNEDVAGGTDVEATDDANAGVDSIDPPELNEPEPGDGNDGSVVV